MQFFSDTLHRIVFSTDASAYREIPRAVAFPECDDDVRELILRARREGVCLIPRAGGTSIAGQVVGNGIVVDVSRYMTRILEINAEERWARVQPGVIRDELNEALKPYGLFFSPETSTSNRCCIGGMVGNNSCGTHSLVYGSTRDHVLQLKGFLSDGSFFDTDVRSGGELEEMIYALLEGWKGDAGVRRMIEENFPDRGLRRRSCGYAIDEALEGENGVDLCKLICGSEGTLCFLTEIKVSLDVLPAGEPMVLCAHCASLEDSYQANLVALRYSPEAVELMDGKVLELAKGNPEALRNRFFVEGDPAALIIAEFRCGGSGCGDGKASELEKELLESGLAYCCTRVYGKDVSRVWALRKAGLGVLNGMPGNAKPVGVVEDTAVAPERLPEYLADFGEMMSRLGLSCVYYGHISTGELHLRPVLDLKTEEGRRLFRQVAEQTALLVRRHKGSLSGEHGDGRLRGEFIPLMYGQECYELMRELKRCCDPDGVFNVGKIVDTPPMDEWLRYDGVGEVPEKLKGLLCSAEKCNGAADCRKLLPGGTLCPAYRVSGRNELFSTRARANLIREVLSRGVDGKVLDAPELKEVLDSCLACKGCRSECPSNVDMTRLRAELLQLIYDNEGTPRRAWMVARMAWFEKMGSYVAPLYNFFASWKPSAALIKSFVGFAQEREIPRVAPAIKGSDTLMTLSGRKVYLFVDEFTRYQEPELALKLKSLLEALGYQVLVPKTVESGRAAISKGCVKLARKFAEENVRLLGDIVSEDVPLVGVEPSCILSFRDEYPDLVPEELREKAERLGRNALLYDEFFVREIEAGRISADSFRGDVCEIWLHGHCHQKALVGIEKTAQMLRMLKGAEVHVIPSGCCGMAGSFGYEKEHYRTSLAIGEMILFPAVRKAVGLDGAREGTAGALVGGSTGEKPVFVAAPGTSCRQQILDGTGVHAVHPIEILLRWLVA